MDLYLIIVVVLFGLAISDLMVGVSNDAVNFLNSAIGSKAAPRVVIMAVASIGILVGTTFSSGLMEVARKGIFHPDQFLFPEIMVIFLAVMLTDILLLDLYNTFGLPTSTTVSIVFELLGSAVAVSTIKILSSGSNFGDIVNYINTSKALAIISGILLSVAVAFTTGAIIQFFTRLIFTFDFESKIKRYGALWAAIALTSITFFILFKGAKGSSFLATETVTWIKSNTYLLMGISFAFWAVLFQILLLFTKINILRPIVLVGTFALALAFAANDLVNFIGVPLAGLSSWQAASGVENPLELAMAALKNPVQTNTILLLLAGIIMVVTLWTSRKARSVTKTEVNLGRQNEGFERFESSVIARVVVRMSLSLLEMIKKVTPLSVQNVIKVRMDGASKTLPAAIDGEAPAFDLLRASVNLMVASILISFATSLKLPLSTTYVTFMVAMGTSLSDRAWGRESAVYRVNGVITVIGGWFFTALMAFTVSFVFAFIIYYGGLTAIIILVLLAAYLIFRSQILHKNKEKEEEEQEKLYKVAGASGNESVLLSLKNAAILFDEVSDVLSSTLNGLKSGDRNILKEAKKKTKDIHKGAIRISTGLFQSVDKMDQSIIKKGNRFGKMTASLQGISNNLKSFTGRCFDHIDNNHSIPDDNHIAELEEVCQFLSSQFGAAGKLLNEVNEENLDQFEIISEKCNESINSLDELEVSRIKSKKDTARNILLFLGCLSDIEKISYHLTNAVKVNNKIQKNIRG